MFFRQGIAFSIGFRYNETSLYVSQYPVCKLCRDHEQAGFIEGIKVGMRLEQELMKE